MKFAKLAVGLGLIAMSCAGMAATTADAVKAALMKKTGLIAEEVRQSPVKGIWEAAIQGRIIYLDETADHVFAGAQIISTATEQNLTALRERELAKANWKKWPLKDALKQVYGNGSREVVVFSDANCQYCRQLEGVWKDVGDVTVYTFVVPIIRGEANNREIVCAANPTQAWHDWMANGVRPPAASASCDKSVLDRNLQMVRRLGITGAPALFFKNGDRIQGSLPAEQIKAILRENA